MIICFGESGFVCTLYELTFTALYPPRSAVLFSRRIQSTSLQPSFSPATNLTITQRRLEMMPVADAFQTYAPKSVVLPAPPYTTARKPGSLISA